MKKLQDTVVAIVGLGLIGGSYAKALKSQKVKRIIGMDRNHIVSLMALDEGYVTELADEDPERLREADVIICCMYPGAFVPFVRDHVKYFEKRCAAYGRDGDQGIHSGPGGCSAGAGDGFCTNPSHGGTGRKGLQPEYLPDFPGGQFAIPDPPGKGTGRNTGNGSGTWPMNWAVPGWLS